MQLTATATTGWESKPLFTPFSMTCTRHRAYESDMTRVSPLLVGMCPAVIDSHSTMCRISHFKPIPTVCCPMTAPPMTPPRTVLKSLGKPSKAVERLAQPLTTTTVRLPIPFPASLAATVNLSWLCHLDAFLSGRRYHDSHLELVLSRKYILLSLILVLPTLTLLVYYSPILSKQFPILVHLFLTYIIHTNILLFFFYTWEISKTLTSLLVPKLLPNRILPPIASGRRNYQAIYKVVFIGPLVYWIIKQGIVASVYIYKHSASVSFVRHPWSFVQHLVTGALSNTTTVAMPHSAMDTGWILASSWPWWAHVSLLFMVLKVIYPFDDIQVALQGIKDVIFLFRWFPFHSLLDYSTDCIVDPDQVDTPSDTTSDISLIPPVSSFCLPDEILVRIHVLGRFELQEMKQLRRVCKKWASCFGTVLFQHCRLVDKEDITACSTYIVYSYRRPSFVSPRTLTHVPLLDFLNRYGGIIQSLDLGDWEHVEATIMSIHTLYSHDDVLLATLWTLLSKVPCVTRLSMTGVTLLQSSTCPTMDMLHMLCPRLQQLDIGSTRYQGVKMLTLWKQSIQKTITCLFSSPVPSSSLDISTYISSLYLQQLLDKQKEDTPDYIVSQNNEDHLVSPSTAVEPDLPRESSLDSPLTAIASLFPDDKLYSTPHVLIAQLWFLHLASLDISGLDFSRLSLKQSRDQEDISLLLFLAESPSLTHSLKRLVLNQCRYINSFDLFRFVLATSDHLECLSLNDTYLDAWFIRWLLKITVFGTDQDQGGEDGMENRGHPMDPLRWRSALLHHLLSPLEGGQPRWHLPLFHPTLFSLHKVSLKRVSRVKEALNVFPRIEAPPEQIPPNRPRPLGRLRRGLRRVSQVLRNIAGEMDQMDVPLLIDSSETLPEIEHVTACPCHTPLVQPRPSVLPLCIDLSETDVHDEHLDRLLTCRFHSSHASPHPTRAIACLGLRGNPHLSGHAVCLAINACHQLSHLDVTDCCLAIRHSSIASLSQAVTPPAIAFSANLLGRTCIERASHIISIQDDV